MKRSENATIQGFICPSVLLTVCIFIVAVRLASGAPPPSAERGVVPAVSPYIDAHTHFDEHDPEGSVREIIQEAPRENMVQDISADPTRYSGPFRRIKRSRHSCSRETLSRQTGGAGGRRDSKFNDPAVGALRR